MTSVEGQVAFMNFRYCNLLCVTPFLPRRTTSILRFSAMSIASDSFPASKTVMPPRCSRSEMLRLKSSSASTIKTWTCTVSNKPTTSASRGVNTLARFFWYQDKGPLPHIRVKAAAQKKAATRTDLCDSGPTIGLLPSGREPKAIFPDPDTSLESSLGQP